MNREEAEISHNETESEEEEEEELGHFFGKIQLFGLTSAYLMPIIIVNNIVTNALILIYAKHLSNSKRALVYYISIALSDLAPTIFHYFLDILIYDGFKHITDGQWYIEINGISDTVCRLQWLLFGQNLQFNNWLLVLFSIERFMAVHFPLRFRNMKARKAMYSIIVLLILSILYHALFINRHNSIPEPHHEGEEECMDTDGSALTLFTINFTIMYFLLPGFLNTFCNLLILIKLRNTSKERSQMLGGRDSGQGKFDLSTTKTLLFVSFFHFLLVIPAVVSGIITRALYSTPGESLDDLAETSHIFASLLNFTNISNGISFYVYFTRIPRFRNRILQICSGETQEAQASKSTIETRNLD